MESTERARLAQQHQYISKGLGFVLHPTIERDLLTRKADVAIASVSEEFQLPGTDDEQTSGQLTYKRPVHFSFQDISSHGDTPSEHQGQFDIVAVRLLHSSLPHDRWETALRKLISLLRPGGWLQWTDWDPLTPRIAAINPAASDAALRDVLIRYIDLMKVQKVGTTYRISNSMSSCGLEDADSDIYPLIPEVQFTRNITTGVINALQQIGELSEPEAEDVRAKTNGEIEAGNPLLWYDLWCHIARKPL